jgi:hypothetical protein
MTIKQIRAELAKRLKAMERERDAMRDLEEEVADQGDRLDEACSSLQDAIDRLSEVV